ncbi:MAG TPA: 4-(cytidine 5'-diphospho)-2-C-methyl-D-erythritol kinase [Burkholderiaceae bacterium]|nr:4-(cytidine 5'-diphospho)-2-C-methyl-D-erythritol kinase [Burkholderiaceae bacterium]
MTRLLLGLPAPAKINLFLHVVGRRSDGYHDLQTAFVPIDVADLLDFERRDDGAIERDGDIVGETERDLCVRAAQALRDAAGIAAGVRISVEKRIPAGSGLGGGSSDAATTLIALNRLWALGWPRSRLAAIGRQLGADVPFFLEPGAAFGEGVGERLTAVDVPPLWVVLVHPAIHVSTAEIFGAPELTRDSKITKISAFCQAASAIARVPFGANDLERVVRRRLAEVDAALTLLERHAGSYARMSGSGSAVFAPFESRADAEAAAAAVRADAPGGWMVRVAASLPEHPLRAW